MQRVMVAAAVLLLSACASLPPELQNVLGGMESAGAGQALSESEIASGLKEALATGTQRAIARIGVRDGFWMNRDINVPLPDAVKKAEKTLRMVGQGAMVDEFHLSLNRAAEAAVPEAATIFGSAIRAMTLDDARRIFDGPSNAATEYFRSKTLPSLTTRFKPLVMQATSRVGVTRKYKEMVGKVGAYVPSLQGQDLDSYVTERALSGLFRTLAEEEYKIRKDPGARTTEILRRVFGGR